MVGKLVVLVGVVAVIGWSLHRAQVKRSQDRLRDLGRALESRGIDFPQWLREAGLDQAALKDRNRRDEVQSRLEAAALRLLSA